MSRITWAPHHATPIAPDAVDDMAERGARDRGCNWAMTGDTVVVFDRDDDGRVVAYDCVIRRRGTVTP